MPSQVEAILIRMRSREMAFLFVGGDELVRLGDGGRGVEGEAGVDFGGDAAGDDLEDFQAEEDEDAVEDRFGEGRAGDAGGLHFVHGLFDEVLVFRFGGGLEDERGVGRRVLRLVGFHRLEIAGVGDDGRRLLQLVELVHAHVVNDVIARGPAWKDRKDRPSGLRHESYFSR